RIEVLVEVQHQDVGDDRIARGEERDQAVDQVPVGGGHLVVQVGNVDLEVDLVHRPGVPDRVAVHLVEVRITHRAQGELEAGVEQHRLAQGERGHRDTSERKRVVTGRLRR